MVVTLPHEPTPKQIEEQALYREMGLTPDEYEQVKCHLGRQPNWTEIGIYSVMWSEHCSYKNSKVLLRRFPTEGPHVLQGPGEGAGVIDIGDGQAVVFKMESHNHPSAIEPFQGAATGVGGIIRDVFSMGARPVALLNSLRFGSLSDARVKYLFEQVVAGIAHYGNCIGIPTVGGEVFFAPSYQENPLVNAMCVGVLNHEDLQQGIASGVGNLVIYVGASTGRDGIHGATFASEELSEESEEKRSAVQVGDPFMEKLLLEACLEMVEQRLLVGIQDMGAAGLTCSSAEMAAKGQTGMELNLDEVPQREQGMTPYEIMLSESQERMLLVVTEENWKQVKAICEKWGLQAAVVGRVTEGNRYRIYQAGQCVADIPVNTLVDDAPVYQRESSVPAYYNEMEKVDVRSPLSEVTVEEALEQLLDSPNLASKRWVYQQYDHMVRTSTAVRPGSDAAVILLRGTEKGLAMSADGNSRYVYLDPEQGGRIAVAEAARNVVCSGAKPLGLTDCLNFGNPEKPENYWQMAQAIEGMSQACRALETPVVGGNVSLYNESQGQAIYPTPIVGMIGLVEKREHITTQAWKEAGDVIYLLGETAEEWGGSELQALVTGTIAGRPPVLDLECEQAVQQCALRMIQNGWVTAAHDVSEGGLLWALIESSMSGDKGASIELQTELSPLAALYSESQSRIVLSVKADACAELEAFAADCGVPIQKLGEVVDGDRLTVSVNSKTVIDRSVSAMKQRWEEALACKMKAFSTN